MSAVLYVVALLVVRGRAANRAERRYRWGTWVLVVVLALSALVNVASDSPWERYLMAPVALLLAGLCLIVARGHGRRPAQRRVGVPTRYQA